MNRINTPGFFSDPLFRAALAKDDILSCWQDVTGFDKLSFRMIILRFHQLSPHIRNARYIVHQKFR